MMRSNLTLRSPVADDAILFQGKRPISASAQVRVVFVAGKLPQAPDGVSVAIDGKPASVNHVSPKQLNVLAPSVTNATAAGVTVTNLSPANTLRRSVPMVPSQRPPI